MEYEKSYVYEPEIGRPSKRRRIEPQGLHASWPTRRKAFNAAWKARQNHIDSRLQTLTLHHVEELKGFLQDPPKEEQNGRISTAILVSGPESSSYSKIIEHLAANLSTSKHTVLTHISPSAGANLKSLLKAVIQGATSRQDGRDDDDDDEDLVPQLKKGARLPKYDLQLLANSVAERNLEKVVIAIGDTEAFDSDLLSEIIELFGKWHGRIPFTIILGVATDINNLQQRLSRSAVRCLHGRSIDASRPLVELEEVLEGCVQDHPPIWPGADFIGPVLERQQDYIQGIDSFVQSVKYAYMSHYYANPLSLFLVANIRFADIPADHFEALRNATSFRSHCKALLEEGGVRHLRSLLESDEELFNLVMKQIPEVQRTLSAMLPAIDLLQQILHMTLKSPSTPEASLSKLYTSAVAGRLTSESTLIRSTLLTIRKSPVATIMSISALLSMMLSTSSPKQAHRVGAMHNRLLELRGSAAGENVELRSEEEIRNSTLRTTVVARKVELSKQKATLSKRDEEYTAIVKQMSDLLDQYFGEAFVDPKSMLFHELIIYDLRSPYKEALTPRPRHAIERALAAPHDYLDCECCVPNAGEGDERTLAASQPATAVLYQLYLESGSLINVHDLWQAFRAVMMPSSEEEERPEEELMTQFQRALAELKYLVFVKATRKRADHVAKVAWRGL